MKNIIKKLYFTPGVIINIFNQRFFVNKFIKANKDIIKGMLLDDKFLEQGYTLKHIKSILHWVINDFVNLYREKYNKYNNFGQLVIDCKNEVLSSFYKQYNVDKTTLDFINIFIKDFIEVFSKSRSKYI